MNERATGNVASGAFGENERVKLLEAATKLVASLSKPEDLITKMAYQVHDSLVALASTAED